MVPTCCGMKIVMQPPAGAAAATTAAGKEAGNTKSSAGSSKTGEGGLAAFSFGGPKGKEPPQFLGVPKGLREEFAAKAAGKDAIEAAESSRSGRRGRRGDPKGNDDDKWL
jgi:hypothetical protein